MPGCRTLVNHVATSSPRVVRTTRRFQFGSKTVSSASGRRQRATSPRAATGSWTCMSTRSMRQPAREPSGNGSASPTACTRPAVGTARSRAARSRLTLRSTPTVRTPTDASSAKSCPAPHPRSRIRPSGRRERVRHGRVVLQYATRLEPSHRGTQRVVPDRQPRPGTRRPTCRLHRRNPGGRSPLTLPGGRTHPHCRQLQVRPVSQFVSTPGRSNRSIAHRAALRRLVSPSHSHSTVLVTLLRNENPVRRSA